MPGRFLASFAKFIGQYISDPYMHNLVAHGLDLFLTKNVLKYKDHKELPVHFTGYVAYYFGNILRDVAIDKGLQVKHITQQPIAGLTLFHQ